MVLLEAFSGIGGFAKGLHEAGFNFSEHYFSEVDKHAIANYKHNFPNAKSIGSVTDVRGGELKRPNIITFGSPCQDFSLAGNRLGMDGQRSSLILHAIRLIQECRPDFFIWENVKGAFSSNDGADFWGIIQAFANIGGYRLEWQLLNTAWFLPQNRERIYLIGHLATAGRSFRGVFPIGETNELYPKTNSEKPSKIASTLNASDNESWVGNFIKISEVGKLNSSQDGKDFSVLGLSPTLNAGHGNVTKIEVKSGTLRTHKDGKGFRENDGNNTPTIPARARKDGSGQVVIQINANTESGGKQPYQQNRVYDADGISPAIMKDKADLLIQANTKKGYDEANEGDSVNLSNPNSKTRRGRVGKGIAQTLDTQSNQAVIVASRGRNPHNTKSRKSGEKTEQFLEPNLNGTTNTLTSVQKDNLVSYNPQIHNTNMSGDVYKNEFAGTLRGEASTNYQLVNGIRRLTEIECERLQGFPENWTKFGNYDGVTKEIPKTQRYKLCGNAVTVEVVRQIGIRLIQD